MYLDDAWNVINNLSNQNIKFDMIFYHFHAMDQVFSQLIMILLHQVVEMLYAVRKTLILKQMRGDGKQILIV